MKKWIRKWDLSVIYKVFLVLLDIVFINISSFLALWIRFNMYLADIPIEYYTSVKELVIPNTIATLIVFAIFKLYTSLWRYASIKELVNIIEACAVCMLLNVLGYYLTYRPIYRSYFVLYGAALFLLTCLSRFSYRLIRLLYRSNLHGAHMRNTMIIGAGEACNVVMKELELMVHQIEMNRPVGQVLEEFAERAEQEDVENFVHVFTAAKKSGGDSISMIRNAVRVISEKIDTEKEIQTMLASKKLEFDIMCAVPLVIILYMKMTFGEFLDVLYGNAAGAAVMTICLILYTGAYLSGRKLIRIEV